MFMTVKQAAEKWGLSDRRVRILCAEGKIPGAFQEGRGWKIPMDAVKPADKRFKSTESLLEMIDRKKAELEATAKADGLENCTFMDWLPAAQLPYSLAAADLGIISLTDETALVSVPSKTFNLLAVGCPLMCIVPQDSEIARMVTKYENGKCFEVNEVEQMVEFIFQLSKDKAQQNRLSTNSLLASRDFTVENAKMYLK